MNIGKCPHGHPGCALGDDIMQFDYVATRVLRNLLEFLKLNAPAAYDFVKVNEQKWSNG